MNFKINQIIFFGFVFHVLAAFFSIGYHQCDELFQVFEFAGYKLGINQLSDLPWEYAAQMRSGIQPLIVYSISKCFYFIGISNPFTIACFIRLIEALFSFFVMIKFLRLFENEIKTESIKKLYWFFGLLLWCVPYFHTRFSSENFSATLFLYGICLFFTHKNSKVLYLFICGIIFGLAFLVRFQSLFFIVGLTLWLFFVSKTSIKDFVIIFFGFLIVLGLGVYIDCWLYNTYTISWWNYLQQNLFESKASNYGTSPFYYYLLEGFLQLIPPFSLFIIFAFFIFWYKSSKSVITWMSIPFILLHVLVPHKELRFLFPLINFLPIIICATIEQLNASKNKIYSIISSSIFFRLAMFINLLLLLFFTFKPANDGAVVFKAIYKYVQGTKPSLYYENNNPYNNQAGLNYFRNTNINTVDLTLVHNVIPATNTYYFFDGFAEQDILLKDSFVFIKIYSNYPAWLKHFNFNGWLTRSGGFSIYRLQK